jgi:6-pyruvoyltetrahydropterin/6-carboxytetrahydropterin synthase
VTQYSGQGRGACSTLKVRKDLRVRTRNTFLLQENPMAANIAKLIYEFAREQGFPVTCVDLWETPNCFATYD